MWFIQNINFQNQDFIKKNQQGIIPPDQRQALDPGGQGPVSFIRSGAAWKKLNIPIWIWLFGSLAVFSLSDSAVYAAAFFVVGLVGLAALFFWFWRRHRERVQLIQGELSDGTIRSGIGEVLFIKGSYRVDLDGQQLHLGKAGRAGLSPGVRYRFYYLPESGLLLSAEAVGPVPEQQAVKGLTEVLAEVNNFDLDSLPENRRGSLTSSQLGKLVQPILIGLFALGFPAAVILYGWYAETGFLRSLRESPDLIGGLGELTTGLWVINLVLIGLGLFGVYFLVTALLDLWNREVVSLEGTGLRQRKQSRDTDGSTRENFYYLVGGKEFQVGKDAYQAFENGRKYRVYYTPRRKRLVNLEVLD